MSPFIVTRERLASKPGRGLVPLARCCAACGAIVGQLPVLPERAPELHHRDECPRVGWPWREAVLDIEGEPTLPADWSERLLQVAVATLEQARRKAAEITPAEDRALADACAALTEAGGTIPLPDGSRVTVAATTYTALLLELEGVWTSTLESTGAEILAAWNAEHGAAYV